MIRPVLNADHPVLDVAPLVSSAQRRRAQAGAPLARRLGTDGVAGPEDPTADEDALRLTMLVAVLGAVETARASPCSKSHRGAAAWSVFDLDPHVAHNAPPPPMACAGDLCRAICTHAAEHAEAAALRQYLRSGWPPTDILHVKVTLETGDPTRSTEPSCASCSRGMLAAGVEFVWLWTADGWRSWSAAEFHRLSLQADPKIPEALSHDDIDRLFKIGKAP